MFENFFFVALPYIAILLLVGGTIVRAFKNHWVWSARGDYLWTTRTTGFFGRQTIGPAALCIHWGLITLFITHLIGFIGGGYNLSSWVEVFRWVGMIGGLMLLYGLLWALYRRIFNLQVKAMSQADDYITLSFLIIIVSFALWQSLVEQLFGISYAAGPWVGSIFTFQPDASLISGAPLVNQLHIIFALLFFCYFPFSKLVHAASYPFSYFTRPRISMRTYWGLKK
ncbi:MAG: respiratory nitrate reductase subunit gamma [Ignavibacteriaceae bacterium]|jgi:nitrate reductase gamma subunit|nr:MAG: hypothetical protein EDM69_03240 [Chlorobiota bacterium]KXK05780.1 MAG: nitrate reductase 1, gamma (cytochrome b(NR)) subunit [Chlorobi bacterium OLB4]MBV6398388.1 Respiratory nitrate reductase 1 gamma chain [Ignavibacteria bacterium]MCC6886020.1 respiratory nitrate reductase subunit gamma [Ignavibacteriales bacterium]MCE7952730.1 hypothetical protein [Chlorobi bacterium CHB7]MDL1886840.1 respiratory nitrate reductase subunit gamma [Ignavibacteria bacterium CHB1]MEB2330250.1 respirato